MRAGQIATNINSDLQVPLDLAPIADADGNKYYPEFEEEFDLEECSIFSDILSSGFDAFPTGSYSDVSSVSMQINKNGVYIVGTDLGSRYVLRRLDLDTLRTLAEYVGVGRLYSLATGDEGDLLYIQDDGLANKSYLRLDPITLEIVATSPPQTTPMYRVMVTKNGVYANVGGVSRFDRLTLSLLATCPTLTGWSQSLGYAVSEVALVKATIAGSAPTRYIMATMYNPLTLAVMYTRAQLLADNSPTGADVNSYSNPKILIANNFGYLLGYTHAYTPQGGTVTNYPESMWFSYDAFGTSATIPAVADFYFNVNVFYAINVKDDNFCALYITTNGSNVTLSEYKFYDGKGSSISQLVIVPAYFQTSMSSVRAILNDENFSQAIYAKRVQTSAEVYVSKVSRNGINGSYNIKTWQYNSIPVVSYNGRAYGFGGGRVFRYKLKYKLNGNHIKKEVTQ